MMGAAVFVYGLLMSFVLSGASMNKKKARPNPRILEYVGYVLCGVSGGVSLLLFASAFSGAPLQI